MMTDTTIPAPEWWQRGPVEGIQPLFQPAAHALLQAGDELQQALQNFPSDLLWTSVHGMASVGFHLRHIIGVLDRLFTYAREKSLTETQLAYLQSEGLPNDQLTAEQLVEAIHAQIKTCLNDLSTMGNEAPTAARFIGRKKYPPRSSD